MDPGQIAIILGALGGLTGLAALFNSFTKAKSSEVATLVTILQTQAKHIDGLQGQIIRLEKKISELSAELVEWKQRYDELARWVRDQGLVPFE